MNDIIGIFVSICIILPFFALSYRYAYHRVDIRRARMHTLLSVPKSEMLDVEHNIKRLAKNFSDMGCSCEEAVESLKKLQIKEGKNDMNTLTFVLTDGTVITTKTVKGDSGETVNKPKSTNCPNCGAPVDIHDEKCAYCDTPYI